MTDSLQETVKRILEEVKKSSSTEAIRNALEGFAKDYAKIPVKEISTQDQHDKAAFHLIQTIVGEDNLPAIELYKSFYESSKRRYKEE